MTFDPKSENLAGRPAGVPRRKPNTDAHPLAREQMRWAPAWAEEPIRLFNQGVAAEGWAIVGPRAADARTRLQHGLTLVRQGAPIIVGMSLENGYFSRETITRLFRFLAALDAQVHYLVMDTPARHDYAALGYRPEEIKHKIKSRGDDLRRKISQALKGPELREHASSFKDLPWHQVLSHSSFAPALAAVQSLYASNERSFHRDVRDPVKEYLNKKLEKLGRPNSTARMRNIAAQYPLAELALMLASIEILASPQVVYLYHKEWTAFEKLITGGYGQAAMPHLGFVQLGVTGPREKEAPPASAQGESREPALNDGNKSPAQTRRGT